MSVRRRCGRGRRATASPSRERLDSGHRRYDERDVEAGAPGGPAARRRRAGQGGDRTGAPTEPKSRPGSIFAALRRERPELQVSRLPKRSLIAISRAIEDESAYGARDLLLFGAFQRERHYRASEPRWRELSRGVRARRACSPTSRACATRAAVRWSPDRCARPARARMVRGLRQQRPGGLHGRLGAARPGGRGRLRPPVRDDLDRRSRDRPVRRPHLLRARPRAHRRDRRATRRAGGPLGRRAAARRGPDRRG